MADHVNANPTKGTGKAPRIPRPSRQLPVRAPQPTLPLKRKSRSRDANEVKDKVLRLENQNQSRRANRSASHPSTERREVSPRHLRKRKAEVDEPFEVEVVDVAEGSDTDEESTTTEYESNSSTGNDLCGQPVPGKSSDVNTESKPQGHSEREKGNKADKSKTSKSQKQRSTTRASSELSEQNTIASRLRLTPSRAAAASCKASASSSATTGIPSTPSKQSNKQARHRKNSRSSKEQVSSTNSKIGNLQSSTGTTESSYSDDCDSNLPGPSSRDSNPECRYSLRSRGHSESQPGPSSSAKSSKDKETNRSAKATAIKEAQILSNKERHLRKKTSSAGANSANSSSNNNSSGNSKSGGRGPSATAASSSTTGSCASSSRCGRGGGPSSSEVSGGPSSTTTKSGETGMSNQSSSGQPQASSSRGAEGGESGNGASSSLSAAAAASAFSRGLAMLAGETDGDEGEMGRLQALLEARGLPPQLFGSLAPRMQQLLHRGMNNSTVTKAQQLLQGLQAVGDEGQQLQAAIEMCQLLVMGNEDTLAGFPVKQTVPALIALLSMEHNFDMMNHACRALTYMMEALPRSTPVVVEAVPVFLEKLQVIQCMDVAEQSLTALEMLSRRHAKSILQARGVSACLTYLDFFSITAQRAALSITANCCQSVHSDEITLVMDSLPFLASRLTQQDKKSVESVCLAFSRLVDSFNNDPKRLEEIASSELLANLQQLLVVTPPVVSTGTFILVLRMLAQLCARCPSIAVKLLEQNIVGTLSSLLLGSANSPVDHLSDDVELVSRNPQELLEIVAMIAELLPKLPKDGIFSVNTMMAHPQVACQDAVQWQWRDDRGTWNSYSSFDSKIIETAHQAGEDEISLSMTGRTYTVDFLGMQQINEDTGTARTVQRKVNPFFNAKGSENKEKASPDLRTAYLESHPDFALQFLRPLFALLSEANSSSAGPAVRQGCVKTLLRIVHFLPADCLEKNLKAQLVANNLASMLGSSDLKIVVGAFQLSFIFMDKLQDVFVIHFRREGVFHQISRISTSEIVGPSPVKSEIAHLLGVPPSGGTLSSASASHSSSLPSSSHSVMSSGLLVPLHSHANSVTNVSAVPTTGSLPILPVSQLQIPLVNVPSAPSVSMHAMPITLPLPIPQLPVSQYGICMGGFFMQPGSSAPNVTSRTSDLTISCTQDARDGRVIEPVISLPSSSLSAAVFGSNSGQSSSTTAHSSSSASNNNKERNNSALEASSDSPSTPGSSSAGSKNDDSAQALCEAFKRKRLSKRPIPTSTSRRVRQEDPTLITASTAGAAASSIVVHDFMSRGPPAVNTTAPSNTISNSAGIPHGPAQTAGKRATTNKSSFFASLHPSRWTRGASSSSNNNSASSVANPHDRSHNTVIPVPSTSSSLRGHSSSAYLMISCKEHVKTWLKEQSTAFTLKYCKSSSDNGQNADVSSNDDGVSILPKLTGIIAQLREKSKVLVALRELRSIVVESDISSFEVNHSGLIGALLSFLTEVDGYETPRDTRLRSFVHVFADCPLDPLSGEELDSFICRAGVGASGLSSLVAKLNSCFSQLEQFQVKVHELPTTSGSSRVAPTSALRFFNTHQLKCVLQRHPTCTSLRQWKGGPVKIDPLALVQAIERYLIVRGFGRVRESRDSGDSEDENSDDDIDDSLATVVISQATRHKLQFMIGDHVLPYNMTVYQAIRQYGMSATDPNAELEAELDPTSALLGSSGIWAQTHTIYYRPVPEDGGNSSVSSSAKSSSKKSKIPTGKHTSKSKKDPMWNDGLVPDPIAPYLQYLNGKLPDSVSILDPSLPVLALLRVIHALCRFWRYFYWPILPGQPLLPLTEFINTKVAAKAQRQLQDPVVIMTGNLPQWLQQIGVACPFLFPFETRQMLFYSISFDRDRALQRLLDAVPELNSTEREDRVTPRLDRRKRTISRDNILHHAEQLMQDFGSTRPLLEIQYENEVGTGLGPTLEFYALVSQELQKRELDLWHSESSTDHSIGKEELVDAKSKSYVHTSVGLFPRPVAKSVKANQLTKIKSKFKFMGRFMAKAVMDSRMIDLPLSKTQYKWILGEENSMSLADMADVDSTVASSIRQLVAVVSQKKKLEAKSGFSPVDLNTALENLTLDGCRIDNLGLDFTLPGYPHIELRKGGKDIPVTIHNLEEYIKLVCHWMLSGGVSRQMEAWREGFDSVFPSGALKMFYPEELEMVFCGANQSVGESWDIKTLMECCRPDHGYAHDSRAIQFLFEVMSSYDSQERRKFIQFVTGSPRLPVGGLRALQPPLTIVRKTIETNCDVDSYLPSVMTCVNYLKLPDYSTIENMRNRLRTASEEGQMSFHLS